MITIGLGYLRVSSAAQRDRITIESQRRDVPAYIKAQGWQFGGCFEDDGRTAKAGHLEARDGYARTLARCKEIIAGDSRVRVVVTVVSVDRLTRSEDPLERVQVIASITATGAMLAIVGAGIQDPRTFAGDAYLTLQSLFAAEDNRRRREKVNAGEMTAVSRGRKPRGWTPYGLTYDAEAEGAKGWGVDRDHAETVREIVRRTRAGQASGTIARDLERRGIERPRGGRWTSERVRTIVQSDVYAGRFVVNKERGLVVPVPTFLDADELHEARAVLVARYKRPPLRIRYHHLLTGLATCGLCGAPVGLAGTTDRETGAQPTAYRCTARRAPLAGKAPCVLPLIRTATTDEWVWGTVIEAISRPEIVDRQWNALHGDTARPDPDKHRAELERIDAAQAAALDHAARGTISQATADAQVRRLGMARREAGEALRCALAAETGIRAVVSRSVLEQRLADLRVGLERATTEERRRWLAVLTGRAIVGPRAVSIDLRLDVPTIMRTSQAPQVSARQPAPVTSVHLGTIRVLADRRDRRRTALGA